MSSSGERELTCAFHRDYCFTNKLARYPSPLRFLETRREGVREIVEEWFRLGIIDVNKQKIEVLVGKERWAYFWLLGARYGLLRPEWNLNLHLEIVGQLFSWWEMIAIGPVCVKTVDILPLICVKGNCRLFYSGLLMFPRRLMAGLSEELLLRLFDQAADLYPEWFMEFWMSGEADEIPLNNHPLGKMLATDAVISWLVARKSDFYARRLRFTNELLAVTHHPSRTLDCTMDWKELEEFRERWGCGILGSRVWLRAALDDL